MAAARVAWLIPVALAAIVWLPITRNYFHFDDFLDLYQLRNDPPAQYFLRMYGGHLLIARHAVTAALDAVFGPDPAAVLRRRARSPISSTPALCALVERLTGRWSLAVLAAAVWGTSPINEGALGWYAVYGQVAATTCILAVSWASRACGRWKVAERWAAPVGWASLMLVAGLLVRRRHRRRAGDARRGVAAHAARRGAPARGRRAERRRRALLGAYAVVRALELPLYGEQRIETTMMIGGLTPAYLGAHLQLLTVLLGFGAGALPLAAAGSTPNSYPTAAHFVAAGVVAALLLAERWRPGERTPAVSPPACSCCSAIYGLIAVARSMLVGWVGLWPLGRSLRFHYAAGAMLVAAAAVAAGMCLARWQPPARAGQVLFAAALAGRDLDGDRLGATGRSFRRRPRRNDAGAGRDPRRHRRGAAGRHGRDPQPPIRLRRLPERRLSRPLPRHRRRLRDLLSRRRRRRPARGLHQRRRAGAEGSPRRPPQPDAAARVARPTGSR